MIDVKFKAITSGTCAWCGKQRDELFDVEFADKSFVGSYCRTDLLKAVGMKCEKAEAKGASSGTSHGTTTTHGTGSSGANGTAVTNSTSHGVSSSTPAPK